MSSTRSKHQVRTASVTCVLGLALAATAAPLTASGQGDSPDSGVNAPQIAIASAADDSCASSDSADPSPREVLEPPGAHDELEENPPVVPEIGPQSTALDSTASAANANLNPILRAPQTEDAAAAADALAPSVEFGIRWCVLEPQNDVYNWQLLDQKLAAFASAGVPVKTLRVVEAPNWATTETCKGLVRDGFVILCPPPASKEPDIRSFAAALARRYGPTDNLGSAYEVERLSFWNEPNVPRNWGAKDWGSKAAEAARAETYSDRLVPFYGGAKSQSGDSGIKIDAGEVAAGSFQLNSQGEGGNGVRMWADAFARYNRSKNRDNFDVFTIHPYSEWAGQIPRKVENYRDLLNGNPVGVTEFAWGVSDSQHWKCAASEAQQAAKFEEAVRLVREASVAIHRLVWFSTIDNQIDKDRDVKCKSGYYDSTIRNRTNTFGLYKRTPLGEFPAPLQPRSLRNSYRAVQR